MAKVLVIYRGPAHRLRVTEDEPWHLRNGEPFRVEESALRMLSRAPYRHRFDVVEEEEGESVSPALAPSNSSPPSPPEAPKRKRGRPPRGNGGAREER